MEKPSAVLFLSTRAFAHMTFNRYAKYLGIPTCHLFHGLLAVQPLKTDHTAYKINRKRIVNLFFRKIKRNIDLLLPVYAKSLLVTRAPLSYWFSFLKAIYEQATQKIYGVAPLDTETMFGFIYTNADLDHMHGVYRVLFQHIYSVGNPDLILFGVKEHDFAHALKQQENKKEIIYVATALTDAAVAFDNLDQFIAHLKYTRDLLAGVGLHLVVKLHPGHFLTGVPGQLQILGINLCKREDFVNRLKSARAAMVEPSTAAMIPALLGLPLLLCKYGKLSGLQYGEVLTSYPRSRYLTQLTDLPALLDEEQDALDPQAVHEWIALNSGPMPAEDMPERVAAAIDDMVRGDNHTG